MQILIFLAKNKKNRSQYKINNWNFNFIYPWLLTLSRCGLAAIRRFGNTEGGKTGTRPASAVAHVKRAKFKLLVNNAHCWVVGLLTEATYAQLSDLDHIAEIRGRRWRRGSTCIRMCLCRFLVIAAHPPRVLVCAEELQAAHQRWIYWIDGRLVVVMVTELTQYDRRLGNLL